ncbi:hypothetical protein GCM10027403_17150 [Arthrobacter tecti]
MNTTSVESEAPVTTQNDVEIIVDNPQAEITGTWSTSSFAANYYGTNYRTTRRSTFSEQPRVVRWRFTVPAAGEYVVGVWLPDGQGDRADVVPYRLHHAGKVSEFTLDHRQKGGRWRQLGRGPLTFSGGSEEYLELRVADVVSGGHIMADAARVATPPPPLTSAPSGLRSRTGRNYIELYWNELAGADSYVLSRKAGGGEFEDLRESSAKGYLDLDIAQGQTYAYRVAGINGVGVGPQSTPITASPVKGVPLEAVQALVLENVGGNPSLKWRAAHDATSYRIERANKSGGKFRTVGEVTGTEFVDRQAPREGHYIVRAVNANGAAVLSSWQVNWTSLDR